ncbi:MAG: ABC transporter ATP-binding protein [Deltaproteobacteria bacterium]|nr:ABC transporter ATP-binding protein [Deltaproteobacteria bacterium]
MTDVSLAVADGELVVLVGPSGCGKSTLLRVIAGLESATRGAVKIAGRVVNDASPQERNVAMVFQDYALYPHLTARGNLEFPLKMRHMAKDEIARRVDAVARSLAIDRWLDRLPKQLSGGERQRVAMGRALVREPSLSLLDEPLSNLDARLRVQVRAEIKELQRRIRTTMVYVTHDQVEAMTLGDRVAVLDGGRLQQVDTPAALYRAPCNTFVAGFIGNPPMNLIETRLVAPESGEGVAIALGPVALSIDTRHFAGEAIVAARAAGGTVLTAGVRPEHVHLGDEGGVLATVLHAENLGHETLVHVGIRGGPRLLARAPGMVDLAPGATTRVVFEPAEIHLFDARGAALARSR